MEECTVRVHLCSERNPRPSELSPLHLGVKVTRLFSDDEGGIQTSRSALLSDGQRNSTAEGAEVKLRKRNGPYNCRGGMKKALALSSNKNKNDTRTRDKIYKNRTKILSPTDVQRGGRSILNVFR